MRWIDNSIERYPDFEQRCSIGLFLHGHILEIEAYKNAFFERRDTFNRICQTIIHSKNPQIQYHALFTVWIISFDHRIAIILHRYVLDEFYL